MRAVFLNSGGGGNVRPSASSASMVASGIAPPPSLAARVRLSATRVTSPRRETPTEGCRRGPPPCPCKQEIRDRRNRDGCTRGVVRGRRARLRLPFEVLYGALPLEGQRRQPRRLRHGRHRRQRRIPGGIFASSDTEYVTFYVSVPDLEAKL